MTKVLVVHGSRHGATEGIAQRIGEVLRAQGLAAPVVSAGTSPTRTFATLTRSSSAAPSTWVNGSRNRLSSSSIIRRCCEPARSGCSAAARCPAPRAARTRATRSPMRSVRSPDPEAGAAGRSRTSPRRSAHAITGSFSGSSTRRLHPERSPNASSGCCPLQRACSRAATSGTGRTLRRGPLRSLPRRSRRPCPSDLQAKSIRITTRRSVGWLTSSKPASAKMLRLPTCISPQVMS